MTDKRDSPFDYKTFHDLELTDAVADMVYICENGNDNDLSDMEEIKLQIANLKSDVWKALNGGE